MKTISGSILILAASIQWGPIMLKSSLMDELGIIAIPLTIAGIWLMIVGLKTEGSKD